MDSPQLNSPARRQSQTRKQRASISTHATIKLTPELSKEEQEDYGRADVSRAVRHRNMVTLRNTNAKGQLVPYDLCCSANEFGKFGVGLELFFKFLRNGALVLLIMAIIAVVFSLRYNYSAEGIPEVQRKSAYVTTTFGNQIDLITANFSNSTTCPNNNCQTFQDTVDDKLKPIIYSDLAYILIFLVFVLYSRMTLRSDAQKVEAENISTGDYAIEVRNIPGYGVTEGDLKEFFSQFGQVIEAKLARNYSGTLSLLADAVKIETKLNYEEARLAFDSKGTRSRAKADRYKRQLDYKKTKVKTILKEKFTNFTSHEDYPSLKGFVIFNDLVVKRRVLALFSRYNDTSFFSWLCGCCCSKTIPKKHMIKGTYLPTLYQPPEPSNIIWENLDVTKSERFFRNIVVALVVVGLLFITFIITLVANYAQGTKTVEGCKAQTDIYLQDYNRFRAATLQAKTIEEIDGIWIDSYLSSTSRSTTISKSDGVFCFCQQSGYVKTIKEDICQSYIADRTLAQLLTQLVGLVVIILNQILRLCLFKLGKFQRYHTATEETGSIVAKVFISIFLNTAIIPLLSNGDIFGFQPSSLTKPVDPIIELQRKSQYLTDFSRNWYQVVGVKIISTMMFAIISPHLIYIITIPFRQYRKKKLEELVLIQKDMNELYTPPRYDLASNYAYALNVLFVSLFYASTMPLLLCTASLTFFVMYWCQKYIILRYASKPPNYDHLINLRVLKLLPVAAILHLGVAVYAYGTPFILPYFASGKIDNYDQTKLTDPNNTVPYRIERSRPLFILLVIVFALYLIDTVIISVIRFFLRIVCCCFFGNDDEGDTETTAKQTRRKFGTFQAEYARLQIYGIPSYDVSNHPAYKEIIKVIDKLNAPDDRERQSLLASDGAGAISLPTAKSTPNSTSVPILKPVPIHGGVSTPKSSLTAPTPTQNANPIPPSPGAQRRSLAGNAAIPPSPALATPSNGKK